MTRSCVTNDGNEAAAYVAHKTNEVIAIYPITPASPMGELSDLWSTQDQPNIGGDVPDVVEMQAEGAAAGAVQEVMDFALISQAATLESRVPFLHVFDGFRTSHEIQKIERLAGEDIRVLTANATGCSSIFGGNLPAMPWTVGRDGRGPAWSNSLFEDNAEFGLGMRLAVKKQQRRRRLHSKNILTMPTCTSCLGAALPLRGSTRPRFRSWNAPRPWMLLPAATAQRGPRDHALILYADDAAPERRTRFINQGVAVAFEREVNGS